VRLEVYILSLCFLFVFGVMALRSNFAALTVKDEQHEFVGWSDASSNSSADLPSELLAEVFNSVWISQIQPARGPKQQNTQSALYIPENWTAKDAFSMKPSTWFEVFGNAFVDIRQIGIALLYKKSKSDKKTIFSSPSKDKEKKQETESQVLLLSTREEDRWLCDSQFDEDSVAIINLGADAKSSLEEFTWKEDSNLISCFRLKVRIGKYSGGEQSPPFTLAVYVNRNITDRRSVLSLKPDAKIKFRVLSRIEKPTSPTKAPVNQEEKQRLENLKLIMKTAIDNVQTEADLKKICAFMKRLKLL